MSGRTEPDSQQRLLVRDSPPVGVPASAFAEDQAGHGSGTGVEAAGPSSRPSAASMACQGRSDGPTQPARRRAESQKTPSRSATRNVTKGSAGSWVTEPKRGRAWEAGAGTRGSRVRVSARYLMPTFERDVCSGWPAGSEAAAPSSEAHESGQDLGCRFSHEARLAHRCLGWNLH